MSLCITCAKNNQTCCQLGRGVILLTEGDIERIKGFVKHENFIADVPPREYMFFRVYSGLDPNMKAYALSAEGTIYSAAENENGECFFLTDKGCKLPPEVRPLYCRIHPYDFVEDTVTGISFLDCPVHLIDKKSELPELVQVSYEDALAWVKQMYKELREGKRHYENRNHLRSA